MKHTISNSLLSILLVVLFMSCSKDEVVPTIASSQTREETYIGLTAREWTTDQSGKFVCTFTDFMHSSGDASVLPIAKVYLLTNGNEMMISHGPIVFMSGMLWSEQQGQDLKVYYEPFVVQAEIPFQSLNLRVEKK